ncbi:hypothetical protein JCM9279_001625 [Rhodotorula babjevae]
MTPPSSVTLEGDTLPPPVAEHGTSVALGRPLVHADQGGDEPRGEPDNRTASPHDQLPPQPALNALTDSLAATDLAGSSPPLPPLPATSSPYPLLPDVPRSTAARAPSGPPAAADDEVEALVDPSESAARPGTRKSSLTPSEEALILPGVRNGAMPTATARRRPSVDAQSVASGVSGRSAQSGGQHSFATAKNYFPLVQKRSAASGSTTAATASSAAGDPWGAPASPGGARASPAGTPAPETPPPLRQARRRPSGSSSLASSTRPTSVFPTIKPSRSASSSVFPLRSPPPSSSIPVADSPSARSSDAGSLRSESLLGAPASPPPSILARPTPSPARSGTSPSLFSLPRPDSSLYAPSLAPSRRSNETTTTSTSRRALALAKPSYASSRAPSHAEAFLASAPEPLAGPPSIFLNPMPQPRSVRELVPNPKRRLSAFFGAGKAKAAAAPSPSPSTAAAGPSRGKSASILDAALASSATWAAHRGEQWRAPASSSASTSGGGGGAGFGALAGYRPAHQVRRQQEEAAARLAAERSGVGEGGAASPGGPTMGGGGEVPVSGEAIAEAFTRNQGREALAASGGGGGGGGGEAGGAREGEGAGGGRGAGLERTRSGVSMASVAGIDEPASARGGGAFPVRREAFPTKARAQGGSVRE